MAIKVIRVGQVSGTNVVPLGSKFCTVGDFASMLTHFEAVSQPADECQWKIELVVGDGAAARSVTIDLVPFISSSDYGKSNMEPIFIRTNSTKTGQSLIFFREQFFLPERPIYTEADKQEVILRVKKLAYDEDAELARLRSAVGNIEAAVEYTKSGPVRSAISDDVKMLVWRRDGGVCVNCGSNNKLQFDHIIPVAKGGSNTIENIQVLCAPCNLRKSANIVIPQQRGTAKVWLGASFRKKYGESMNIFRNKSYEERLTEALEKSAKEHTPDAARKILETAII